MCRPTRPIMAIQKTAASLMSGLSRSKAFPATSAHLTALPVSARPTSPLALPLSHCARWRRQPVTTESVHWSARPPQLGPTSEPVMRSAAPPAPPASPSRPSASAHTPPRLMWARQHPPAATICLLQMRAKTRQGASGAPTALRTANLPSKAIASQLRSPARCEHGHARRPPGQCCKPLGMVCLHAACHKRMVF